MRVVLDTNVLVSALIFPGATPETVYRLALEGRIELVTSPPLLAELARVLAEKFGWTQVAVTEALEQIRRIALIVEPSNSLRVIATDPADDRVLEAANAADAPVIVSGDHHLLDLGGWQSLRILSPAAFLAESATATRSPTGH